MVRLPTAVTFMTPALIVFSPFVASIVALVASDAALSPEASSRSNHGQQRENQCSLHE